jgi:hypothetical protein
MADMTKKETTEDYQKFLSEGVVNNATMTASLSIRKLYSKNTFTHPAENEDEVITVKGLDDIALTEALQQQQDLLNKGDVTSLENMLLSQTHVLNAVFTNMVSQLSTADTLKKLDTYGRLALKAQAQTRQTISTLAEIKGIKKTTFIHQVNQAHNQQVNNGAAEKLNNSSNERVINDVDTRIETGSTREDSNDEALALPENAGGASTFSPECTQARNEVSKVAGVRKAVS